MSADYDFDAIKDYVLYFLNYYYELSCYSNDGNIYVRRLSDGEFVPFNLHSLAHLFYHEGLRSNGNGVPQEFFYFKVGQKIAEHINKELQRRSLCLERESM